MKKIIPIILLTLGLYLNVASQTKVRYTFMDGNKNSEIYDGKYFIIRSVEEWKSIKERSVVKDTNILKTISAIDFTNQALILYFAGSQCNGAEVSDVAEENGMISINMNRLSYDRGCHDAALLVTPWLLIRFAAKKGDTVTVNENVKLVNCD
jgi:hypothetical protein